tara:strand:- start:1532 stop:1978 length:447 start_codon:yes stop_codon:yes gene_type:complete
MHQAFHFIKFKPSGALLTMKDHSHQMRYMCFSSRQTAVDAVQYISLFRSRNGVFPVLDVSEGKSKVKVPRKFKKRTVQDISRFFEVDTYDRDDLDTMARTTNSHFLYVHKFNFKNDSEMNVSFSGQEVDAYVDQDEYVALLEYNLKIK